MSEDSPPPEALDRQRARAEELRRTHQSLRAQRAEVAETAAAVHDEAGRVHEELGDAARLRPADLRAHAEADRTLAAEERAALAAELEADRERD